jgi:hypothetical protein
MTSVWAHILLAGRTFCGSSRGGRNTRSTSTRVRFCWYSYSRIEKINTWDFKWRIFYKKDFYNFRLSKILLKILRPFSIDFYTYIYKCMTHSCMTVAIPYFPYPLNSFSYLFPLLGLAILYIYIWLVFA